LKALTKISGERKANLMKVGGLDELEILEGAVRFLKERFKAAVTVYSEDDGKRVDPKNRAAMAMPNQPAIYLE